MATVKEDFTAKFQTTKDGDIEATVFKVGDTVTVVHVWDRFFLVKDNNGHFYNVPKSKITP